MPTEVSEESLRRARNAVEACGHAKGGTDACRRCIARAIDEAMAEAITQERLRITVEMAKIFGRHAYD